MQADNIYYLVGGTVLRSVNHEYNGNTVHRHLRAKVNMQFSYRNIFARIHEHFLSPCLSRPMNIITKTLTSPHGYRLHLQFSTHILQVPNDMNLTADSNAMINIYSYVAYVHGDVSGATCETQNCQDTKKGKKNRMLGTRRTLKPSAFHFFLCVCSSFPLFFLLFSFDSIALFIRKLYDGCERITKVFHSIRPSQACCVSVRIVCVGKFTFTKCMSAWNETTFGRKRQAQ